MKTDGRFLTLENSEQWMVNTLEVIVNHYKELEDEIREVRQEYEEILRNHNLKKFMKELKEKP